MEIHELEELKEKIEIAKSKKAKNEGALEQIEKKWKEEYDCDCVGDVEELIEHTKEELELLEDKKNKYEKDIEKVMQEVHNECG